MEELLAEVNLCSGAGAADLDRLAADQRVLLVQVTRIASVLPTTWMILLLRS